MSDSEAPDYHATLLHMCMLMSLQEARMGRNKTKVASYGREKLSTAATSRKWNRVIINCVQKYNREDQFGLRSFSLFSDGHSVEDRECGSTLLSPTQTVISSPSTLQQTSGTKRWKDVWSDPRHNHKLPSSSDSLLLSTQGSITSPRGTREHQSSDSSTPKKHQKIFKKNDRPSDQEDFEFSGLERQSRLFHDCMRGKSEKDPASTPSRGNTMENKILRKITVDKDKYRESSDTLYPRKKLLKKSLPRAELMKDFVDSYKEAEKKGDPEVAGALHKMSSHGTTSICTCHDNNSRSSGC